MGFKAEQRIYADMKELIGSFCGGYSLAGRNYVVGEDSVLRLSNPGNGLKYGISAAGSPVQLRVSTEGVLEEYKTWGRNVLQWGQPTLQELPSPCILMNIASSEKYGWVSTKYAYKPDEGAGYANIRQYRLVDMVLSFYRSEGDLIGDGFDPSSYISADDMANRLRAHILSDIGLASVFGLGYGLRDASLIQNPPLVLDGEVYARVPNFTLTLAVRDTDSYEADFVDWEQQISNNDTKKQSKTEIIGV